MERDGTTGTEWGTKTKQKNTEVRTAEGGDMSCGVRQRTLRQVLEYFPQSTVRYCGGRDFQLGMAYASRASRFVLRFGSFRRCSFRRRSFRRICNPPHISIRVCDPEKTNSSLFSAACFRVGGLYNRKKFLRIINPHI